MLIFFLNFFNINNFLNIILVLNIVLVGGILPLIERKFLSLIQRRVGPNFVGYKGKLQFVADAVKVFLKNVIVLSKLNKSIFFLIPMLYLNLILLFWVNIYWYNNIYYIDLEYSFIFFFIIDILLNILTIFLGFFLKNKYTIISSNRQIILFFNVEILFAIILINIYFYINSFSFSKFFILNIEFIGFFYLLLNIPIFLLFFCIDLNRVPFDNVEAETEIIMGYHSELSSFLFGLFVLAEYLHIFFLCYIFNLVFFCRCLVIFLI